LEISPSSQIPPTLQNPHATPLPTTEGKNQERLDPKKRSETGETHPNSAPHACSPLPPSHQEHREMSRTGLRIPAHTLRPANGTSQPNRTGGTRCPAQIPATPAMAVHHIGSTKKKERCRLRRSPAESGSRRCYPLPPPPTARRWVWAVEWQNGGRGSEREGDRERGRSAPPHTQAGRRNKQPE
jgi:hypothetical protein